MADIPAPCPGRARHQGQPAPVWGAIVTVSAKEDGIDCGLRDGGGQMTRFRGADALFRCTALTFSLMSLAIAGAAMKATSKPFEGQIKSIRINKCGLQPGTCEGSIILSQSNGGEVELAIRPGTWLKRGDQLVTIDELGVGNYVKTEAIQLPGEPLQRITILSSP